jgi:2-polyprenyl-3-methyl-5-hydroxy-6-metoxy-1,4-benzoquinol methylase
MSMAEARPYESMFARAREHERTRLGTMADFAWSDDPKRFAFTSARYLAVGRLLQGRERVLEVGCGDGFFSRIVAQHVKQLTAIDRDEGFIQDAIARKNGDWPIEFQHRDLMDGLPFGRRFDAIFALDVLEHIDPRDEVQFLRNAMLALGDHGIAVIGIPSLQSQHLASAYSRQEHVNCKTAAGLRATMATFFHSIFIVAMNDTALHCDEEMAHYLFAVCADPRTYISKIENGQFENHPFSSRLDPSCPVESRRV